MNLPSATLNAGRLFSGPREHGRTGLPMFAVLATTVRQVLPLIVKIKVADSCGGGPTKTRPCIRHAFEIHRRRCHVGSTVEFGKEIAS